MLKDASAEDPIAAVRAVTGGRRLVGSRGLAPGLAEYRMLVLPSLRTGSGARAPYRARAGGTSGDGARCDEPRDRGRGSVALTADPTPPEVHGGQNRLRPLKLTARWRARRGPPGLPIGQVAGLVQPVQHVRDRILHRSEAHAEVAFRRRCVDRASVRGDPHTAEVEGQPERQHALDDVSS